MSARVGDVRRAWLLVSGAAVTVVATVVLLALVVAALMAGRGAATATAYGLAAVASALAAVGLLVLARSGVVARSRAWRAEKLCVRITLAALGAVVGLLVAGGIAVLLTRSGTPMAGGGVSVVLLVPLAGLAARQRAVQRAADQAVLHASLRASARRSLRASLPPPVPPPRSGGGRESEPDPAVGAR